MTDQPRTTDVIVIGSGCAGLAAAQSAAEDGARVVVVERASVVGGTTAISGGGMWLPCSTLARAQGIDDSPEEVRTYLERLAAGRTNSDLIDAFVTRCPLAFDMLSSTGRSFELVNIPDYKTDMPGSRTGGRVIWPGLYDSRWLGNKKHLIRDTPEPGGMPALNFAELDGASWGMNAHNRQWYKQVLNRRADGILGQGRALTAIQFEACLKRGVVFELEAQFTDLIQDPQGRVGGVVFNQGGTTRILSATLGVVLASGGFEWNRQMWRDMLGVPLDLPLSPPGNDGAALRAAARVGARLGNLNEVWWMPALQVPDETYGGQPRLRMAASGKSLPGAIVVNSHGHRFANESMNYNDFGQYMVRFDPQSYGFPNYPCYAIFDATHREHYMPIAYDGDHHDNASWITEAQTLSELADKLAIDPAGLEHQVSRFNQDAQRGVDSEFQRGGLDYERSGKFGDRNRVNPNLAPVATAPFYGYRLQVSCLGTKGGPVINGKAQVVDHNNQPITGLCAAGNAAAAVFGTAYPGGGSTLGAALTFGYIAGKTLTKKH